MKLSTDRLTNNCVSYFCFIIAFIISTSNIFIANKERIHFLEIPFVKRADSYNV